MKPTLQECQKLKMLFTSDIDRMLLCLTGTGVATTDDEVVQAWARYSDENHADWLGLPESDETLRELLIKYLAIERAQIVWRVIGTDADDGSGDFIVPLPTELSEQLGWQIGDELSIERIEPGTLRLRRI